MADLSRGKELDAAPGVVGVAPSELPPLPDAILTDPLAGRLDPRTWYADPAHPLEIEIGCGKGGFILTQAESEPRTNFLGIEWAYEYYAYAADRVRRRGLRNVRMLHANAADFLHWRCPDAIVRVIHLYFSDPWPKRKHHKNRVVQDRFLADCWRVLEPGGELRVVTDHDDLWAWNMEHFRRWTTPGASADAWAALRDVRRAVARPGLPAEGAPRCAPFELRDFAPPPWVGDGQLVGTNYERKMCPDRAPHAAVLRRC